MKKNVMRVISMLLVLGMVFAFAACKQDIYVHFVDKDGNDIQMGGMSIGTNNGGDNGNTVSDPATSETPVTQETPSETPTETPSTPAPGGDTTSTTAPSGGNTPSTTAPAAQPTGGMPTTKDAIVAFYKAACQKAKAGECGYTKKEYQAVGSLNITGNGTIDGIIENILGNYMTKEDAAEEQVNAKGSDDAKNRWGAEFSGGADLVKDATCVKDGSNYKITITTVAENTPKTRAESKLAGITQSILYWEDIDKELKGISQLKEYSAIEVKYNVVTIEAVMTPDGKFVSLNHTANVDIVIGHAKILFLNIDNKSAHLDNYCKYYSFQY